MSRDGSRGVQVAPESRTDRISFHRAGVSLMNRAPLHPDSRLLCLTERDTGEYGWVAGSLKTSRGESGVEDIVTSNLSTFSRVILAAG